MDKIANLDWTLIQSFLAVAENGSLSAAARALGQSQPTLGRHIEALETQLGAELFIRHARGFNLSDTGAALLPDAEAMRTAMGQILLTVAGQSTDLRGTVRITASVFAAHQLLPPILANIRAAEPDISLELVPTDDTENLLFREADIAVRMYRPTQLDVITQHIANTDLGVFAATTYLDRKGRPSKLEDLMNHDLVGYDRNDLIIRAMRDAGWPVTRDNFATRCDNQATYWELVRFGCGIGFSQMAVGLADPLVEQVAPIDIPPLPVWLTAHEAMRQTPRIRRVWDMLAEGLRTRLNAT
jgi:DNA-binding transcriptional LysR family regulator